MKLFAALLSVITLCATQNASAQPAQDGWQYSAGAGVIFAPTYLGDEEYSFMFVPDVRVTYDDKFFASIGEGVGYNLINNDNWRAGPIMRIDFGRDEDGEAPFQIAGPDTNDLRGLGDVDTAPEIGGFIEYTWRPIVTKLELRQAIGGHKGFVGDVSAQYQTRTQYGQTPIFVSFGPEIKFADANFHEAYFGVNAGQSNRSGLAQYDPDGDILSYVLRTL